MFVFSIVNSNPVNSNSAVSITNADHLSYLVDIFDNGFVNIQSSIIEYEQEDVPDSEDEFEDENE